MSKVFRSVRPGSKKREDAMWARRLAKSQRLAASHRRTITHIPKPSAHPHCLLSAELACLNMISCSHWGMFEVPLYVTLGPMVRLGGEYERVPFDNLWDLYGR